MVGNSPWVWITGCSESLEMPPLSFEVKENRVLLAMRKSSWVSRVWNGVGGELNTGETVRAMQ